MKLDNHSLGKCLQQLVLHDYIDIHYILDLYLLLLRIRVQTCYLEIFWGLHSNICCLVGAILSSVTYFPHQKPSTSLLHLYYAFLIYFTTLFLIHFNYISLVHWTTLFDTHFTTPF